MLVSDKLVKIRESLNLGTQEMAEIFNVSYRTLRRLEKGEAIPNERTAYQISSAIQGMTPENLLDLKTDVPLPVRLSDMYLATNMGTLPTTRYGHTVAQLHDGKRLKKFLQQQGVRQARLAEWLEVHRAAVNGYFMSQSLRPHIREKIIAVLKQYHNPAISAVDVFGVVDVFSTPESGSTPDQPTSNANRSSLGAFAFVSAPLIESHHRQAPPNPCKPVDLAGPESNFLVSKQLLESQAKLAGTTPVGAICIAVAETDYIDPLARPGAVLLGFALSDTTLENLDEGLLLLHVDNRLILRRLLSNHLLIDGKIDVGIYSPARPGSQTIDRSRLHCAYRITTVLQSPV